MSITKFVWAGALGADSCLPPSCECAVHVTLRAVRWELEARGVIAVVGAPNKVRVWAREGRDRGTWTAAARSWDMDGRSATEWHRAITSCDVCPCWRSAARIRILRSSVQLALDE